MSSDQVITEVNVISKDKMSHLSIPFLENVLWKVANLLPVII